MSYTINVKRKEKTGRLTFKHGNISVDTTCWWDPEVKVDPGEYTGYATRMASKNDGHDGGKREGIWFGTGVPVNKGTRTSNGIFIHKGTSAAWSDGCIVIVESAVIKIWNAITPKEQPNVSIVIEDQADQPSAVMPMPRNPYSRLPFACRFFDDVP